jgi:CheY-like chemotaxis protein
LEATRRIRQQPGGTGTVIIALTASALDDDRRLVLQNGVDDFLTKPCREDKLLDKIRLFLSLSYIYEDSEPPRKESNLVSRSDPKSTRIEKLPSELINELQLAVRDGKKNYLDGLIEQAGDWDVAVSRALKDLADVYDYEALTSLLERLEG